MVLALFVSRFRGGGDELAAARYDNTHLRQRITELEAKLAIQTQAQAVQSASATAANCASSTPAAAAGANPSAVAAAAPAASSSGISGGVAATAPASQSFATQLLELHSHWDWKAIAKELLMPFSYVDEGMLENGVRTCYENGTMYCMRAQIRNNELFITDYRAVFFDRHYAPARIMPLLDVLRRHKIPDVDIVVAAVDEPRVKVRVDAREWSRTILRYSGSLQCKGGSYLTPHGQRLPLPDPPAPTGEGQKRAYGAASLPPPLFSSTVNRAHFDLPWPDFSFYMPRKPHKLRTPPWSKLHPQMLRESSTVEWATKIPLAVHTGNVGSAYRKRLAEEAKRSPNEILVNELFIG